MAKLKQPISPRESRQEDAQFRVMQAIAAKPNITQRELAAALGVSLGRAHYCLASLIEVGWVKVGNFRNSSNKRHYTYVLTPSGLAQKAAAAGRFLVRKQQEYEALRMEIEAIQQEFALKTVPDC